MIQTKAETRLYMLFPHMQSEDFVVGEDSFDDVEIDRTQKDKLCYFTNRKKGLIKRFVLQRTQQTEKVCKVTLIEKTPGNFTPRFSFEIVNITKSACESFSKNGVDDALIKARVDLDSCHENFLELVNFIKSLTEVDFGPERYSVIDNKAKAVFESLTKEAAISGFAAKYGDELSEKDINVLQNRREKLEYFRKLLYEEGFFEAELESLKTATGKEKRREDLWQSFFEDNQWIFGYGLQLVACEGLDHSKLEQTIVAKSLVEPNGKRVDALLKTRGAVSKLLFCEIKLHDPDLLLANYERTGVFIPGKELSGAVAQVQKTIHKLGLSIGENYLRPQGADGSFTGEEYLVVKPRGIVVIGRLDDFVEEHGVNYEKLSSFEIYRQQISGIEVVTYDELYERTKFIVGDV